MKASVLLILMSFFLGLSSVSADIPLRQQYKRAAPFTKGWLGGFGTSGRVVNELDYSVGLSFATPFLISIIHQSNEWQFEGEVGYFRVKSSESVFQVTRRHFEFNLMTHYALIPDEGDNWIPRLTGGLSFFREEVATSIGDNFEELQGSIKVAPVFGLGFDGPIARNLRAQVELRSFVSPEFASSFVVEIGVGLQMVF